MVPEWPRWTTLGHGFADAASLPVGLPLLIVASAAVVVAAAALPPRHADVAPPLADRAGPAGRMTLRLLAAVTVVAIAVPAALGPSDVALNPAPRLLFTVVWAGMMVLSALLGPWWRHASPVAAAAAEQRPDDRAAVVWPAAVTLAVFGMFEQVLEPSPLTTLAALVLYVVGGAAVAVRGGRQRLAETDPLEVTSVALGSLAPVARGARWLRSPRHGTAAHPALPGLAAFLGVLGGMNLYDALEPGGALVARGAVYLAVVGITALAFWAAARPAFLAPALIPAVAGHLGAHYLFPLLVDTQVAAVLASDPLRRGWNLLGLTGAEVNAEPIPAQLGLVLQLLLLVAGHALAMVVAGDLAKSRLGPRAASAALFGIRGVIVLSLVAGVYLRFGGP